DWMLIGRRTTAPNHAFGDAVTGTTIYSDFRPVNGVLYPYRLSDYNEVTGKVVGAGEPWATIEANGDVPLSAVAPPAVPDTPIARLVNAIFKSRYVAADALGWFHDFQTDVATRGLDTEGAIESVGYHCLKNGAVPTGTALLEENL